MTNSAVWFDDLKDGTGNKSEEDCCHCLRPIPRFVSKLEGFVHRIIRGILDFGVGASVTDVHRSKKVDQCFDGTKVGNGPVDIEPSEGSPTAEKQFSCQSFDGFSVKLGIVAGVGADTTGKVFSGTMIGQTFAGIAPWAGAAAGLICVHNLGVLDKKLGVLDKKLDKLLSHQATSIRFTRDWNQLTLLPEQVNVCGDGAAVLRLAGRLSREQFNRVLCFGTAMDQQIDQGSKVVKFAINESIYTEQEFIDLAMDKILLIQNRGDSKISVITVSIRDVEPGDDLQSRYE